MSIIYSIGLGQNSCLRLVWMLYIVTVTSVFANKVLLTFASHVGKKSWYSNKVTVNIVSIKIHKTKPTVLASQNV